PGAWDSRAIDPRRRSDMTKRFLGMAAACLLVSLNGCGGGDEPPPPVFLRGHVVSISGTPIAGAVVFAQNVNEAPVTTTDVTDQNGAYELNVSAARNSSVKLRASAAGYESFPSGIRRSLPIDLSGAVLQGEVLVFSGLETEVTLEPLESVAGLGSLSGTVEGTGALVVAEGPVVRSAVSDVNGPYVIFNLPAGIYQVKAYAAGAQFVPVSAAVAEGLQTTDVDLARSGMAAGSVSGNVNIVNAPGGSATSVVLVVASTFNDVTLRGDVPPGLRAPRTGPPNVSGSFTIDGVPNGTYKVLAAFENDQLVRDPDPNISGTQIVEVTVTGNATTLPTSFKITECLNVVSPGGGNDPTVVIGTPTFIWADDSSEDYYSLDVFDSYGNILWSDPDVPSVSGGGTVSVVYAGPTLEPGRTYQFRATSWRVPGGEAGPISNTEDLKGVFIAQ
ncbi:MAG TPA: carboxypeptidase-like regulatory domain-containing protein, partial [Candidatus Eisenbacteria bacterium]|nr:carboxypeptidase-like regulatory domain-containing protein [Candidatus Eisenbacteria bacterium]